MKIKDYENKTVGVSKVLSFIKLVNLPNHKKMALWKCLCKCGLFHNKTSGDLARCIRLNQPNTCGDRICALKINIGDKFGRLVVKQFKRVKQKTKDTTMIYVKCKCSCGKIKDVRPNSLESGKIKSCGCFRSELLSKRNVTHNQSGTPEYWLYHWAKARAKEQKLPFNIEIKDIRIPKICPILKIQIHKSESGTIERNSPTLDKIIVKKGYTKGNIRVISNRANLIKSNGNLEEFKKILKYMEN